MNVKNLVLGIGIVIVFGLVLWQGIEAFYPSADYNDYCGGVRTAEFIDTPDRCEANGGQWNAYSTKDPTTNATGYCDLYYTCSREYQDAMKDHSQVVFYVALIVGIIAIIAGYAILSVEPVGSALIGSGIWSFVYGTMVNWANLSNVWRFLLLLVALALLIYIALRINRIKKR